MSKTGVLTVKVVGDAKPFEKTMGKIGKTAGVAFAAVGVAAAGVAAGLFKVGESFDKQFDKIRVGTGATGDALTGLEDSFKNVLKSVPASFDDAGSAIADLNTRLGLTGKPLEELAGQFINLSRITETDLSTNVDNITRVFGDWGVAVEDQAESMDKLYRAAQSSGIGIDELSTSVVQFGAPLRNLGFGFDESLALLAQFNKTGVNTETVFAGLKAGVGKLAKAGEDVPTTFKRVVDEITKMGPGSEATGKAIELFGQRAGPDLADAIAGGKFEIDQMLGAITGGTDTINGAAKDTESFGEKWLMFKNRVLVGLEPIASKVFDAIGKGMDKISKFASDAMPAIKQVFDILFKGDFKGGPFSEDSKIVDVFFDIREAAVSMFEAVSGWIADVGPAIQSWVEDVLGNLSKWWSDNGPKIISIAEKLRDALIKAFEKIVRAVQFVVRNWDKFKVAVAIAVGIMIPHFIALGVQAVLSSVKQVGAWAAANAAAIAGAVTHSAQVAIMVAKWAFIGVQSLLHAAKVAAAWLIAMGPIGLVIAAVVGLVVIIVKNWDTIKKVIAAGWEWVKRTTAAVWDGIKSAVSTAVGAVVGFVTGIPGRIAGVVSTMWNGIKTGIEAARSFVGEKIDAVVGFVTGMPRRISTAASGLFDGIKNAFRGALNWIIDKWNGLSFRLPAIDIPGIGKIGGATLSTPNIPRLATGGVVSSPTLALVGDAGRGNPEIVAPEQMLRRIMREEGGGTTNHYHISGIGDRELLRVVRDAIESANRSGI